MAAERSDANEPDERLCAVLLEFLESAERGAAPESAELLARHPELAAELEEFFDTWVRVEGLTEPLRSVSQVLQKAALSPDHPIPSGGDATGLSLPATRVSENDAKPHPGLLDRPLTQSTGDDSGWLSRWLRQHPPLVATDYPFLIAHQRKEEIGKLGPYRLLEVIGSGGMGVVFRGEDVALQRQVAVKVLRAELAADPRFRERFLREARSAAAVSHEHVIAVYHVGEEGGIPYMGMQWLRGISLEGLLRRAGQLSVPTVIRLGRQIALGLAAAHEQGLLHRDIKPANLWIELAASVPLGAEVDAAADGRVKILDFGLVRAISDEGHLTVSGATVGTPAYMAPEQATGASVDARCDLFSLGIVLYRMCTGRLPFAARHQASVQGTPAVESPASVQILNPAVPQKLSELVLELLARDPAGRPASAIEVIARLSEFETRDKGPPTAAPKLTPPAPPIASISRDRLQRRVVAVALALTVLLPLGYLFGGTVLRFATNRGEVIIAVDDPDADVTVKESGAVIEDRKGERRIVLTAGEHELEVTVREASGEMHFFTKAFVLRRGSKEVVNVRHELASGASTTSSNAGEVDRPAAEWALALGGKVTVRAVDRESELGSARDLPAGTFRVVAVDLSGAKIGDSGLAPLSALADLRYLRLSRTLIGDRELAQLSGLKGLRTLVLNQTKVSGPGLASLSGLQGLVDLDVSSTAVDGPSLVHLQPLTDLGFLNLYDTRLTDAGLEHLQTLTKLRGLFLSDTPISDAGLAHLRTLTNLEVLHLNNLRVTDDGIANLEGLTKLRSLNLPGTRITDSGLSHLQHLIALEELALDNTRVTDAGLPRLGALKSLRAVNLGGPGVTDAGLEFVGTMTNLRQLGLFGSRVTDTGLNHLSNLTNLELLNLTGLSISEVGLAQLAGATRINWLELSGTRVNDRSIKSIISCNWPLSFLGLRNARISAKSYSILKTTYPGAQVSWSEPNWTVAQSVLAARGTVWVRTAGRTDERLCKLASELPEDYYTVTRYRLPRPGRVPEDLPRQLAALTDPKFDGLVGADFSGGPCNLERLKLLLPKTVTDLSLADTQVNDDQLVHLQAFSLQRLDLQGCPIVGYGLAHLKAAPRLAEALADLSLARTQFGDAQMRQLRAFSKLHRLDLSGCSVRGPGLSVLTELPMLRELLLACPTMTDPFAEELGGLTRVERLSLASSSVTDQTLKHLKRLTKLQELDLTGTKVTVEGVAALRTALPGCDVKSGPLGLR